MEFEDHEPFDLTPLAEAAAATHEVFRALVEAGFAEGEAIRLVATIVVESTFE